MNRLPFLPDAMIFDLDGTLLDTEPLYTEAAQAVINPYGAVYSMDLKRKIMGGDSLKGAEVTVAELDLPMTAQEFLDQRKVHLERLFPQTEEIADAARFLNAAAEAGIPLGLATSSHERLCDVKIGDRRWRSLFHTIVCGDDPSLTRSKPEPDIFLLTASRMAVQPERTIAFEDSRNGVRAAKAAGMTVVAINSVYVGEGDLNEADLIVDGFDALF